MEIKKTITDFRNFILDFEATVRKEYGLVEEDIYQEIHKLFSKSKGSINYKRGNIKGVLLSIPWSRMFCRERWCKM